MKGNFKGIVELARELERQDGVKNDFTPLTNQIEMSMDGHNISLKRVGTYGMTPLFEDQLADKLSIPRKYYDFTKNVPGLTADNVNKLLNHTVERKMVRTLEGNARAFLSDRFKPIDHLFVMNPFLNTLNDYGKKSGGVFSVKSTSLSPSRMYIQIVFPNITGEIISAGRGKEMVNAGITLVNSEVGLGAFDVRTFIWWEWCSNGAIAESLIRKYHTGRKIGDDEEDYGIYSDETIKKEMDAFQSRLKDIFHHALTEQAFADVVRKIQRTTEDTVEKPQTLIENVTKRYLLTEDQGERILSNMVQEGNMNRYGLVNGITRLAQEVEQTDQAYDLERLGNDIITLKPSDWEVLNN